MTITNFLKNKKVLVTCGPTWIPIDDTRIIGNISTGQLGQIIANDMSKTGARVTLLQGPVAAQLTSKKVRIQKFIYYNQFLELVKNELRKPYDIAIHAAAVSDYKLKKQFKQKLSSNRKELKLDLVATEKIINIIKKYNPHIFLVGFKLISRLTQASARRKAKALFQNADCDLIVANSMSGGHYNGYILNKDCHFLAHSTTRKTISKKLIRILNKSL